MPSYLPNHEETNSRGLAVKVFHSRDAGMGYTKFVYLKTDGDGLLIKTGDSCESGEAETGLWCGLTPKDAMRLGMALLKMGMEVKKPPKKP